MPHAYQLQRTKVLRLRRCALQMLRPNVHLGRKRWEGCAEEYGLSYTYRRRQTDEGYTTERRGEGVSASLAYVRFSYCVRPARRGSRGRRRGIPRIDA